MSDDEGKEETGNVEDRQMEAATVQGIETEIDEKAAHKALSGLLGSGAVKACLASVRVDPAHVSFLQEQLEISASEAMAMLKRHAGDLEATIEAFVSS